MKKAYEASDYTMQEIADAFGVHYSTVSSALDKTSLKKYMIARLGTAAPLP
jgi:putative transposase